MNWVKESDSANCCCPGELGLIELLLVTVQVELDDGEPDYCVKAASNPAVLENPYWM